MTHLLSKFTGGGFRTTLFRLIRGRSPVNPGTVTSLTTPGAFVSGGFSRNVIYREGVPADLAVAQWAEQYRRMRLEKARAAHLPSKHLVQPWIMATARLAAVEARYV